VRWMLTGFTMQEYCEVIRILKLAADAPPSPTRVLMSPRTEANRRRVVTNTSQQVKCCRR
jgi:hypothetical protein